MKTINNYSIKNKNLLLRVDLNVPVVDGVITDKSRIISIKSSINKLIERKNKIFLISHFGRPKGKYNKKFSLEFICQILGKELGVNKIDFMNGINIDEIRDQQNKMKFGEICLFENIRFYEGEEKNDLNFAKKLSECFDVYINDAFSVSHRNHASIVGITKYLPSLAGDNLLNEINNLNLFLHNPKKPNTAIIGGSKISTKIEILKNLVEYFDNIAICGAMANTFLLAKGLKVGKSLAEHKLIDVAKKIITQGKNFNCNIILPVDVVCSKGLKDLNNIRHSKVENILPNQMILDIGDKSIKKINKILLRSSMILWNGPLGAFEYKPFNHATMEIANTIKKNSKMLNIMTLAGGGDTISAIKMAKAEDSFSYISNAGGAFLEWLEGKESPGIRALKANTLF